ncbi:hydantoinase/oxoprolinase family protein [Chelatococcus sp. GCM10030263]|uniref:hydantoinase/oxoprolinase family protein n=1 Tax=Chelatococcus sp. GCM10030263 TaxID=3273387 RepID=UPI003607C6C0
MSSERQTADSARLRIGVDSGGTFTDVCMFDETSGEVHVWKVASTPQDPSLGIAGGVEQGLAEVARATGRPGEVVYFGHGTTVATNALIVGRGANTGMITTAGFRDIIELRRQKRDSLYDIQTDKPPILVTRDNRLEVRERVTFDGKVFVPIVEEDVRAAVRKLKEAGIRSVAVCFLFSFVAPAHEALVKRILREEMPDAFISVSHEVAPEFREYERFSTTVVNAYLGPIMRSYLERLEPRLKDIGVDTHVHLTQSNGGVISSDVAQDFPARTVLSGPAAGVMGALAMGRYSGFENLITFDMGGTSTDVSLIDGGKPQMSNDAVVHGYPLKLPMLDIHTVGAGGGSIAYVDAGGLLKVGPRSAAADPGPVCYGRGNEEPTVTDANVVLQVLNPTHLLNGRMPIDQARAKAAIARLAEKLGMDVMATAQGIISVVIANMAKAIRVISVERGYDPRDYAMLGFGGAGPIHAARLARELEIPRLVVPKYPGIMCALGLLLTDLRSNMSLTRLQPLSDEEAGSLQQGFASLEERAETWFAQEAIEPQRRSVIRAVDMRYGGQGYELTVHCPAGPIDAAAIKALREGFERAHRQVYGYIAEEEPIQVTTLRLEAVGLVPKAEFKPQAKATTPVETAIVTRREVWLPETGGFTPCPIYDREKLGPGHRIAGPAIVDQMDSTTLVLPGQAATVDPYLNLIIEG